MLILVPALTLLGRSDEPAMLEGHGPISLEVARQLAADAPSMIRVLTHPETGTIVSISRDRYRVPADMRLFLRVRAETCRFPGCIKPAAQCELDHTVDWQYGGPTSVDNLTFLCRGHHNVEGHTGWTLRQLGDGPLEWVSPAGLEHPSNPSGMIRFPQISDPADEAREAPRQNERDDPDSPSSAGADGEESLPF